MKIYNQEKPLNQDFQSTPRLQAGQKRSVDSAQFRDRVEVRSEHKKKKELDPDVLMLKALESFDSNKLAHAIEQGVSINSRPKNAREVPLFYGLIKGGTSDFFKEIMKHDPDTNVKARGFFKETALEFAVTEFDAEATLALLSHGASLTPSLRKDGAAYRLVSDHSPNGYQIKKRFDTFSLLLSALKEEEHEATYFSE